MNEQDNRFKKGVEIRPKRGKRLLNKKIFALDFNLSHLPHVRRAP